MNILTFLKYLRGIFKTALQEGTVHHAVIQSIYDAFVMVDGDIDLMRLEMCLSTASGKWLDYWGDFFTVHRKLGEEDRPYAKRIIEYVIRPKTTIPAIKDYIIDFLNEEYNTEYTREDVNIKEPWKELGKLSHKGTLSDDARFFSGDYWCHSVLDISIPEKLTQDLIDLVLAVKAAGVKIVWSFLNSYDIVTGFNESNEAWANYVRHIQTYVPRVTYSGLVLSNSSLYPTLSGRREIWFWMTNLYEWYAYMHEKNTDLSETITPLDLAGLLDYYEVIENVLTIKDTGMKSSNDPDGILDNIKKISGAKSETEVITHLIKITDDMLQSIQLVDEWMRLSHEGRLSNDGKLFDFRPAHELFNKIMSTIDRWKENNRDYYDKLQAPIVVAEHIAMWYAARNKNWLFNTPTMSQQDFYDLWEVSDNDDHNTYDDITRYEDTTGDKYLTMGDPYQPPIVLSGSPWDWTPIMDSPWLWLSATLTNEELEEIYRMKFSGFPDLVTIETDITTRPEYNMVLSASGELSPQKYLSTTSQVSSPESSLVLSGSGELNKQMTSGAAVQIITEWHGNPEFTRYTYLSGSESIITKRRVVQESMPTLETLIEFEENQVESGKIWNPNEDINYSTRDWFQAPVQIGIYALWLITSHTRQLWNTLAITNEEIEGYWDNPDGSADLEVLPEYFERDHINNQVIYQPPIVIADSPFYWTTQHDIPWLWLSATLTNEELEQIYYKKVGDNPEVFPDLVEVVEVAHKTPEKEFRLSDNAYMNYNKVVTTVEEITHPENNAILSQYVLDGVNRLSGSETTRIVTTTIIPDEKGDHLMDGDKTTYTQEVTVIEHPPTLGKLIELEEHQKQVLYSMRDMLQATIEISELSRAIFYVERNDTQLWDTPIIENRELLDFWEGKDKPYTVTRLGQLILADSVRYQMPLEMSPKPFDWAIPMMYNQLWDTPVLSNAELLKYWDGEGIAPLDGFETDYLSLERKYQPPIFTIRNLYLSNDHNAFDAWWLWSSETITNEELEELYQERYPGEFTDSAPTLERLIELEESEQIQYSHRGQQQSAIVISDKTQTNTFISNPARRLWNSPVITNTQILSFWEGSDKPTEEQFQEMIPTLPEYQLPIVIKPVVESSGLNKTDQPWLWSSAILTNGDLEQVYQSQIGVENPTLQQIMLTEETSDPDTQYSKRGSTQSPVEITVS